MSEVYDSLPWWIRKKHELFFKLPKWYQRWSNERKFWNLLMEGAREESDSRDCLIRAIACAELNKRLGYPDLMDKIERLNNNG